MWLDISTMLRQFRTVLDNAGIERRRFHDPRHSNGTHFTAKGVYPRVTMQIFRHSQIAATVNVFTHPEMVTIKEHRTL